MNKLFLFLIILLPTFSWGCAQEKRKQQIFRVAENQIEKVRFQQIFISFKEVDTSKNRTKAEAKALAEKLFADLTKRPADFPDLVRKYSDDKFPAVYSLANFGQPLAEGDRERNDFPPAVGLKAFELKMGELALIEFDEKSSPAGYHLLMRLPL